MLAGIENSDRIREILTLLRPRSAEPTLFSQSVFYLLCVGLLLLIVYYVTRRYRDRREKERQFRQIGRDQGLKLKQIEFLHRIVRRRRLRNPRRLLTSASIFERHIGDYATDLATRDLDHPDLRRIADIRHSLGFDLLPPEQALTSTRQVDKGQTFLIWEETDHKEGFAPWIVVDRHEAALTIGPLLREDDHGGQRAVLRVGDEVSVRFWREGDTEYRFHTRVVETGAESSLLLRHTGEVERLQQRDFVRVHVDFPITLFLLGEDATPPDEDHREQTAVAMLDGEPPGVGTDSVESGTPENADASRAGASRDEGCEALAGADASEDADAPEDPAPEPGRQYELDAAHQVHGQAVNISAGGIGVLLPKPLPNQRLWLVDPDFTGAFPLAGVLCAVVGDQQGRGNSTVVKLKFEQLTSAAERDIVRQVYEHQILEISGIGREAGQARQQTLQDPPLEED